MRREDDASFLTVIASQVFVLHNREFLDQKSLRIVVRARGIHQGAGGYQRPLRYGVLA